MHEVGGSPSGRKASLCISLPVCRLVSRVSPVKVELGFGSETIKKNIDGVLDVMLQLNEQDIYGLDR